MRDCILWVNLKEYFCHHGCDCKYFMECHCQVLWNKSSSHRGTFIAMLWFTKNSPEWRVIHCCLSTIKSFWKRMKKYGIWEPPQRLSAKQFCSYLEILGQFPSQRAKVEMVIDNHLKLNLKKVDITMHHISVGLSMKCWKTN